ncbi:MAG: aldehyde ferredoxin oxidoreductase family protein [Halodesulfurarchaeum sp.]
MFGYSNRILRVDMSAHSVETEEIDPEVWEMVVGGSGFGAYVLLNEVPADADPLGPENTLIFATGPIQASRFPGAAKFTAVAKSPINGFYGESAAGSHWGVALKEAGYDAVIVEGEAESPKRLTITEDDARLEDASDLWGMDAYETNEAIWEAEDVVPENEMSSAAIGQAGENLVSYSAVTIDNHSFLGRSGMGAVMGSKKLKAIAVEKGDSLPPVADEDDVKNLTRDLSRQIASETEAFQEHGTPIIVTMGEELGDVPTKNWEKGTFDGNEDIGTPKYTEEILTGRLPCVYCPIGCHRDVTVESPEKFATEGAGPEYETLAMLGQNCLIDDLKSISKVNDLCNRYGIDTIALGGILAYLMEAEERDDLDVDTDIDLTWGNEDAPIEFVEKVAHREGIGDLAADGITSLIEDVGADTTSYAVQTKGVMVPAHDPRAFFATGLNYMTGVRGPGHERGNLQLPHYGVMFPEIGVGEEPDRFGYENIAYRTARFQDWSSIWNSLVVCRFMNEGGMTFSDMLDMYNAVTGANLSRPEFLHLSERIFQLQRLANVKFGVSAEDDTLPPRLLEATEEGGHAGEVPDGLESAIDDYYDHRGWTDEGIPTSETLERFDVTDLLGSDIPTAVSDV